MEGVGARLGRSSNRYGTSTVFTGPVRNWEKKWVHVPPPNSTHNHRAAANGSDVSSHLLLYKWTPTAPSQTKDGSPNDNNGGKNSTGHHRNSKKDGSVGADEPPRKKVKYIPIIVLEEQKDDPLEQMDEESKPFEADPNSGEGISNSSGSDEMPNINESGLILDEFRLKLESKLSGFQATAKTVVGRQDLNESTLDLSLGMGARDGEGKFDLKDDH